MLSEKSTVSSTNPSPYIFSHFSHDIPRSLAVGTSKHCFDFRHFLLYKKLHFVAFPLGNCFLLGRAMAYISSQTMFDRTMELLSSDVDLLKVTPPAPVLCREFGAPMLLWGPVSRDEFVIDESELPY